MVAPSINQIKTDIDGIVNEYFSSPVTRYWESSSRESSSAFKPLFSVTNNSKGVRIWPYENLDYSCCLIKKGFNDDSYVGLMVYFFKDSSYLPNEFSKFAKSVATIIGNIAQHINVDHEDGYVYFLIKDCKELYNRLPPILQLHSGIVM